MTKTTPPIDHELSDYVECRTKELCKAAHLKWNKIHSDTRMILTIQAAAEYGMRNRKKKGHAKA